MTVLIFCVAGESKSAPVFGKVFDLRQPDGSTVKVKIWGDEFYQVVESLDGYTLTRDAKTLEIHYAQLSNDGNKLLSTGIPAELRLPAQINIRRHIRINKSAARAKVNAAKARFAAGRNETISALSQTGPILAPSTGNVIGICLIVDFPDEPNTIPGSEVYDFCNKIGYTGFSNNGSIRDYFYDVSDGALTYTNYVPATYYTAEYNKGYYDNPAEEAGPKARELVLEALNWLDDQGFDFSQYDSDSDGQIDAINCFYAGTVSSGWSMGLWPHSWTVSFSADGVSSYNYQISDMGTSLEMGTFCHENGHMICWWPDLYDYGYDSRGIGKYGLMGFGGTLNPREPCAYLKYDAGWANVTTLSTPQANLSVTAGVNSFYKIPHATESNEFYMISNRQQTARDSGLGDAGLAIWHIDTNGDNDNQQMTCSSHYLVTLVQADGDWDLENDINYGDSTDLYDAASYDECSSSTNPNISWWCDGLSALSINSVGPSGNTMFFTFGLIESPPVALAGSAGTTVDTPVTITLNAVDEGLPDPPGVLSYIINSPATHGSLSDRNGRIISNLPYTLANNGSQVIYTPDSGYIGLDSFGFSADDGGTPPDGGDSNTATVSIEIINDIYSADMDTDPGWALDSGTGVSKWRWGTPTGSGGKSHGNTDPTAGYTGSDVIGYNLSGDYFDKISPTQWATTSPINCTGFTNVQLSFYRWLNVEDPTWDHAYIEVSNDGSFWNRIWENSEEITDSAWTLQTFDISSTADSEPSVFIRWGMGPTDASWRYSGWNIDDVIVSGVAVGSVPVITSTPATFATVGQDYYYNVDANGIPDPTFDLIDSPVNMTINPNSGIIEWTPAQAKDVSITVQANNSAGTDSQSFTLTVLPADYFDDNRRSAMWRLFIQDYDNMWLVEDANKLEVRASADINGAPVALYKSNGWSLDGNEDFALEVDFHYSAVSSENGWAGIILENNDSFVSLSAGSDSNEPYFYYKMVTDSNSILEQQLRDPNYGTVYISYDANSTSLYLSHLGYGSENAYTWQTISTPLQILWASPVEVAIGGGSNGALLDSGQAHLDNFKIIKAHLLNWPPPTDLDENGFIGIGDIEVMSQYWLADPNTNPDIRGNLNDDDIVNFLDFAEFRLAW